MATKDFILQGFTERTHLAAVKRLFALPGLTKSIVGAAYVTADGVDLLADSIEAHAKSVIVFAGIRNDTTSHQGLSRLLDLGVKLHVVDTGSSYVVFHPKLFFARSKTAARIVLGSSNLTLGGLNNNIEAGVAIDCDLAVAGDKIVADAIEVQFAQFPKEFPDHVLPIVNKKDLDALLASGRLIDEAVLPPPRPSRTSKAAVGDNVPRISLKVRPIRSARRVSAKQNGKSQQSSPTASLAYDLVWESKPLSRRSLSIPTGPNSNLTGSATLGKGTYEDIDPVVYFRDGVFGALNWTAYTNVRGNQGEEAEAIFNLVVKGVDRGDHKLKITHSLVRAAAAATDHNLPTELLWGSAKPLIAREDLIGRRLLLFKNTVDPTRFMLEID